jgi:flagellar protein FlbD
MIEVTRLNNTKITVNPFLVEYLEETPDTVLVFNSGHKMIVKEKADVIRGLFAEFLSDVNRGALIKK